MVRRLAAHVLILVAAGSLGPASASTRRADVIEAHDDRGLAACNSRLDPGDTCRVAPGTYKTAIRPSRSGREDARIVYACASEAPGACVIDTDGPDTLTLAGTFGAQGAGAGGLSFITVEGFTFEDGPVRVAGRGSRGIVLDRVATRDTDNMRPCASVTTEGGEGTLMSRFDFFQPARSSNAPGARAGCDVISLGTNAGEAGERGTTLKDGRIRGGWNALQIGRCTGCVLDGVTITGAKNHTLSVGASGNRTENLEIRNSIVMASTGFREPTPFVAWQVSGLTLLNNAFMTGWAIPAFGDASIRHEMTVRGPVTIRNNIFYTDRGSVMGLANNGTFAGKNPVAWSVDHNAYVGAGSFGGSLWTDSRDCSLGPQKKLAGSGCPEKQFAPGPKGEVAAGWRLAGFDAHSIVFENTDMVAKTRDSAFPVRGPLWGATAPYSGAMVECLMPGGGAFATDPRWGAGLRPGDRVEYDFDGTVRTVSSVKPDVTCGGADKRVAVALDPPVRPRQNAWILSFGQQKIVRPAYSFQPQPGSPVIDAGDDAHCGHAVKGAHCDIGPVESGSPDAPPRANESIAAGASKEPAVPSTGEVSAAPEPVALAVPVPAPVFAASSPETPELPLLPEAPLPSAASPSPETPKVTAAGPPAPAAPTPVPGEPAAGPPGPEPAQGPGEADPNSATGLPPPAVPADGWDPRVSGIGLGSTGKQVREVLGKAVSVLNASDSQKPPKPEKSLKPGNGGQDERAGQSDSHDAASNAKNTAKPAGGNQPTRRTASYDGLSVTMEGTPGQSDFLVVQFLLNGDKFEITPGIKVGISREELVLLLGEPASARPGEGATEVLSYLLAGGTGHARVSIQDGKVFEVRVARKRG